MTSSALLRSSRYALAGASDGEVAGGVDALAVGEGLAVGGALGVGLVPACGVAVHEIARAAMMAATPRPNLCVLMSARALRPDYPATGRRAETGLRSVECR